jgi:hypothetical protein
MPDKRRVKIPKDPPSPESARKIVTYPRQKYLERVAAVHAVKPETASRPRANNVLKAMPASRCFRRAYQAAGVKRKLPPV